MNPDDFSTQDILNFAKKDASKQGHTLQTKYTFTENALGFYHAVDWNNDKWIFLIFTLQFLLFLLVIAARRAEVQLQAMLFLLIVFLAAGASVFNSWAHQNWQLFSTQDYFDRRGTFVSVIWTGPLVLLLLLQLILMVKLTADLAVKAGRLKVKSNIRKNVKKKKQKDSGPGDIDVTETTSTTTSRRRKMKQRVEVK